MIPARSHQGFTRADLTPAHTVLKERLKPKSSNSVNHQYQKRPINSLAKRGGRRRHNADLTNRIPTSRWRASISTHPPPCTATWRDAYRRRPPAPVKSSSCRSIPFSPHHQLQARIDGRGVQIWRDGDERRGGDQRRRAHARPGGGGGGGGDVRGRAAGAADGAEPHIPPLQVGGRLRSLLRRGPRLRPHPPPSRARLHRRLAAQLRRRDPPSPARRRAASRRRQPRRPQSHGQPHLVSVRGHGGDGEEAEGDEGEVHEADDQRGGVVAHRPALLQGPRRLHDRDLQPREPRARPGRRVRPPQAAPRPPQPAAPDGRAPPPPTTTSK